MRALGVRSDRVPSAVRVRLRGAVVAAVTLAMALGPGMPASAVATDLTPTTITVTSSSNPVYSNQGFALTVHVTSATGAPSGQVRLRAGGLDGLYPLDDGLVVLGVTCGPGSMPVQADYLGSATHAPSSSTEMVQEIWPSYPPSVESVDPRSGGTVAGSVVTIRGSGLAHARSVTFDGVPATLLGDRSLDRILQVVAPPGASGTVAVVVHGTGGENLPSEAALFTYTDLVAIPPERLVSDLTVPPGTPRCVDATDGTGIPGDATAAVVNVTTVHPDGPGYVVVYPDVEGTGRTPAPSTSTVNFENGTDVANATFVQLPANGTLCYQTVGADHVGVLIDVAGYVLPDAGITTGTPRRLLDTRPAAVPRAGDLVGPLVPRVRHTVQVAGRAGVPTDASAVLLNVTVTGATSQGNVRVFPADAAVPNTSVVNLVPGRDKANGTIVPLSADGAVTLWVDAGQPVHVILDVIGFTAQDSPYVPVEPVRLLDSRPAPYHVGPYLGGTLRDLAARTCYQLDLVEEGVPPQATTVVLNVTALHPTSVGNLRVFPPAQDGTLIAPPSGSSINYVAGRAIPNMVVVPIPASRTICLWSDQPLDGRFNVAVDLLGFS